MKYRPSPDPSNAVHEHCHSFVPPLASPPPHSQRYPPPYPCSRRPTSMVLHHLLPSDDVSHCMLRRLSTGVIDG